MARWCLATGQPHASWLSMTQLERQVIYDEACELAEAMRRGR